MSGGPYLAGQLVRMANYQLPFIGASLTLATLGFRDANGNLIDPSTVQLKYKDPTLGTTTTFTYGGGQIVRDGTGLYHYDVDTTGKTGIWVYEWLAPAQTIQSNSFQVLADPL